MIPTSWTRRQQVSPSLPTPTAFLQSLTVGKDFKTSQSGKTQSGIEIVPPQPIEGVLLNVKGDTYYTDEQEEESDPVMIYPTPVTPDAAMKINSSNTRSHGGFPSRKNNNQNVNQSDNQSSNRWSSLRSKTASKLRLAVERSKHAEMLGVDRTRKQHIRQKREFMKQKSSAASAASAASSSGALSAGDEFSDHNTDTPYKPPTSSCDGDVLSIGSGGPMREKSLAGTIMSAARTVDRKRNVERNRAFEAQVNHHVSLVNVAKAARRNSKNLGLMNGTVPLVNDARSVGSKESLDSFGKVSTEIPFTEVKRRMNGLRKENRTLRSEKEDVQRQLNKERQESLRMLKQARKEVEERNLKLAVLEEHFIALNEHSNDADFDTNGISFDSNDTLPTKGGNSIKEDDTVLEEGSEHHLADNMSLKSMGESVSHKSSSIIKLDKSYLIDLKRSYEETKIELAKMKHENAERHTVKAEMMRQLEDLSERLRCRETTIASLDEALKQMRAARFKQRSTPSKKRGHKRRSTLNDLSAEPTIIENEVESTLPVNTTKDNYQINEVIIDEAVKEALEIKGREHAEAIKALQDKLELRDTLIKKLRLKNSGLKRMESSKRTFSTRSLDPSSESFTVRDVNMTNEMMNTLTFRLERMIAKIDESMEPVEGIYDASIDLPDEMRPIRKLAAKIGLVNDEMKVTMKLMDLRLKNGIESIKNGNIRSDSTSYALMDRPKSAGQATSSGDKCALESEVNSLRAERQSGQNRNEELEEIQARMAKMLRETETNLGKDVKDLKYQVQDIEVVMESKQDTIEALELACSEHDRNCRSLQEQMSVLVMRLEECADQQTGELHDRYKRVESIDEETA